MPYDQGQFDFDAPGNEAGWRLWRENLDAQKRAFELRWGVILNKRVRVWLTGFAKPLSGKLEWIEPPAGGKNLPPRFRLRNVEFRHDEIESLIREED